MKRILKDNGGVKQTFISENHDETDSFVVQTAQNMDDVLEAVAEMRHKEEQITHRQNVNRNMVPVAEIPMIVYNRAHKEGWHNDPAAWRRWMAHPDNRAFRITDGALR
jgi:hypothetical protein